MALSFCRPRRRSGQPGPSACTPQVARNAAFRLLYQAAIVVPPGFAAGHARAQNHLRRRRRRLLGNASSASTVNGCAPWRLAGDLGSRAATARRRPHGGLRDRKAPRLRRGAAAALAMIATELFLFFVQRRRDVAARVYVNARRTVAHAPADLRRREHACS